MSVHRPAMAELEASLRRRSVRTNGVELLAVEAGPEDGPLVVLLHGFPEYWYGWRYQILPLARAGYRVLVPDQRGYRRSDKPRRIRDYRVDVLVDDVLGLIDDAGHETAALIGHDWGGIVAWWTAVTRPDRVSRLAVLNVPHPAVMRRHVLGNGRQRRRSWYMFWFQVPLLPERWMARRGFAKMRAALGATSRPGTFDDADLQRYAEAWSAPGALTGMVNWYRALRYRPRPVGSLRVRPPALLIWGKRDRFLGHEMARPSIDLCDTGRLEFLDEATHWVQHEEPERVTSLLLDHLGGMEGEPT